MMVGRIEWWFSELENSQRQALLEIRELILMAHPAIEERFTYQTPFYHLNGLLCYFSLQKKKKRLVLGLCDGVLIEDVFGVLKAEEKQTQIRQIYLQDSALIPSAEILTYYITEAVAIKLKPLRH